MGQPLKKTTTHDPSDKMRWRYQCAANAPLRHPRPTVIVKVNLALLKLLKGCFKCVVHNLSIRKIQPRKYYTYYLVISEQFVLELT